VLAAALCVPFMAACSGSSAPSAQNTTSASPTTTVAIAPAAGAAEAAAACHAVNSIKPVTNTSRAAQARYLEEVVAGFGQAKTLAAHAAADDPKWSTLAATAVEEASAFGEIQSASTAGTSSQQPVITAMNQTQTDRPVFIHECQKAVAAAKGSGG
jgi:hypothetical protein